jgi:hypothetical protein
LIGLVSGIDWTTWSSGDSGAARRSVSARTAMKWSSQSWRLSFTDAEDEGRTNSGEGEMPRDAGEAE